MRQASVGVDAAGQGVIGSVALELELSGHGLSNLGTGGFASAAVVLQSSALVFVCLVMIVDHVCSESPMLSYVV